MLHKILEMILRRIKAVIPKEEYENEQDDLRIPVTLMASGSSAFLDLSIQLAFLQTPFC